MGFRLGGKKKASSTSVASKSIASISTDGKSTDSSGNNKLLKKGQRLFQKVVTTKSNNNNNSKDPSILSANKNHNQEHHHNEPSYYPATPSHLAPSATTPATTLLQNDPTTSLVKQQQQERGDQKQQLPYCDTSYYGAHAVEVEYGPSAVRSNYNNNGNSTTNTEDTTIAILQERERIRQQLFYEDDEEGIEVTAQFRPVVEGGGGGDQDFAAQPQRPPADDDSPYNININSNNNARAAAAVAAQSHRQSRRGDEEKKEETPVKQRSHHDDSNSNGKTMMEYLPPTPKLDPSDADPVARFPAVQAAIAARSVPSRPSQTQQQTQQQEIINPSVELVPSSNASAQMASLTSSRRVTADTTANAMNAQQQQTVATATVVAASLAVAAAESPSSEKPFDEAPSSRLPVDAAMALSLSSPSPEKPFDEAHNNNNSRPEDPNIMEMENASAADDDNNNTHEKDDGVLEEEEEEKQEDFFALGAAAAAAAAATGCVGMDDMGVTRKLLDVFNCGDDFTEFSGSANYTANKQRQMSCRMVDAFYDNSCWTYREAANMKRPYYDERFAQRFLKDITEEGVNILWHLPPADDEEESESVLAAGEAANWSGRSVLLKIKPGSCYAGNDAQPKLTWTTLGGGSVAHADKAARCSVPLLAIQSISTINETICEGDGGVKAEEYMDDEDVCLFAITTEEGDVQVFEAASVEQRDLLVTGLKNVIARLSFHLVVGDAGASSQLYYEEEKNPPEGELPSFSSPIQNMNRIAHALMD